MNCRVAIVFLFAALALALATGVPLAGAREDSNTVARPALSPVGSISAVSVAAGSANLTIRRLEGDVNGDCVVNINDEQLIANKYLAAIGSLRYAPMFDVNLPEPDNIIDIRDLQFVFGRHGSTCAVPIPAAPPATGPPTPPVGSITLAKDPSQANIWLCVAGAGECSSTPPVPINSINWQNGIILDEVLTLSVPEFVTSYEFQVQYDPQLFESPTFVDLGLLDNGGLRATTCAVNRGVDTATFQCSSSGAPGSAAELSGSLTLAKVTLLVRPSVASTIRPAKENGLTTTIFDLHALLGTETPPTATPTATSTATALPSTSVPSSTGTPSRVTTTATAAEHTPGARPTTAVPTASASATSSSSAEASGTPTPPAKSWAITVTPVAAGPTVGSEVRGAQSTPGRAPGGNRNQGRGSPVSGLPFTGTGSLRRGLPWIALGVACGGLLLLGWLLLRTARRHEQ